MYAPAGGRWFYTVPETGRYLESSHSMNDLLRQVIAQLETAAFAVPTNLAELIEDHMCKRLPLGACTGEGASGVEHRPGFFEIVETTHKFFKAHRVYVDAREAERRALICRRCSMSDLSMCLSCTDVRKTTRAAVGGRTTHQDEFLGVCKVLAVPAFGLVWADKGPYKPGLPENCWIQNV
jgi:hypothetical protein